MRQELEEHDKSPRLRQPATTTPLYSIQIYSIQMHIVFLSSLAVMPKKATAKSKKKISQLTPQELFDRVKDRPESDPDAASIIGEWLGVPAKGQLPVFYPKVLWPEIACSAMAMRSGLKQAHSRFSEIGANLNKLHAFLMQQPIDQVCTLGLRMMGVCRYFLLDEVLWARLVLETCKLPLHSSITRSLLHHFSQLRALNITHTYIYQDVPISCSLWMLVRMTTVARWPWIS
jgi:hypothetical protein